jgi:hypothetical protein
MQMDESEAQFQKASASMHESLAPDSKVTDASDRSPEKQFLPIFATQAGIKMDESEEH